MKNREGPDEFGRFNAEEVARVCANRGCSLVEVDAKKLAAVIRLNTAPLDSSPEYAVWADTGLWRPEVVYAACSRARFLVTYPDQMPDKINPAEYGLDERRIVTLLASDGIRPFYKGARSVALGAIVRTARFDQGRLAYGERKDVRAATLAVVDAGMATVTLGNRGGWTGATLRWNECARRIKTGILDPEDDAAISNL